MLDADPGPLSPLFYTGQSRFLGANPHFVLAMIAASSHCSIHASEDIFDANGIKLWTRGRAIDERLLERLSNRKLRKPIEVCVYAADPIATAGIAEAIEARVCASADLGAVLEPHLMQVLKTVRGISPNPTELMLLSVMRHAEREMMGHAALVSALALAMATMLDVHPDALRVLARAALLHDVGELYLAPSLFGSTTPRSADEIRDIRTHPAIGAQVAIELARSGAAVGHLIALSHERLDGWGYPRGLTVDDLPLPGRALLFAEAMSPMLESGVNGLRRAAVAARLVPGEFAPEFVNWIVSCGQARPVQPQPELSAEAIGLDLLQVFSVLVRARTLLGGPAARETAAVRTAAARWLTAVEALLRELRMTGVEGALSCGLSVEPQDDTETIELSVLSRELSYRIRTLLLRVEFARADEPELGSSSLVIELLEALGACQPIPDLCKPEDLAERAILPWSKLYSVGVEQIDQQHRVLVGLLNRLGASAGEGANRETVAETLAGLVAYVREHFAAEERLMREHGYPDADAHIAAHARLAERVEAMVARHHQGATPALNELTIFLRQWLISHILQTDKALAMALNAGGLR
jgi:hemerythrin-like metal-binding protein